MTGVWAAIVAICSVLAPILEAWMKLAPERAKEKRDAEVQKGREDLLQGNAGAVTERLDRLLTEPEAASGNAGVQGHVPETRSGGTADRLAALGISVGEAPGKSGEV